MLVKLTAALIRSTQPPAFLRDSVAVGLCVRIPPSGRSVFCIEKTVMNRKLRQTLWPVSEDGDIDKARAEANRRFLLARDGGDHKTDSLQSDARNRTVDEWVPLYGQRLKPNSLAQLKSQIRTMRVGSRRLLDISVSEARQLFDGRVRSSSLSTAHIALRILSSMWEYAAAEFDGLVNPFKRTLKHAPARQGQRRTDFLTLDQLQLYLDHVRKWGGSSGACAECLALTGMRLNEMLGARFEEIDFDGCSITVPASRMKNNKSWTRPLPERVMEILREQKQKHVDYVFPGDKKSDAPATTILSVTRSAAIAAGVPDLTRHGLRRTFITHAHGAGVAESLVRQLTAHALGGVHGGYVMQDMAALRDAAQRVENLLLQ